MTNVNRDYDVRFRWYYVEAFNNGGENNFPRYSFEWAATQAGLADRQIPSQPIA